MLVDPSNFKSNGNSIFGSSGRPWRVNFRTEEATRRKNTSTTGWGNVSNNDVARRS